MEDLVEEEATSSDANNSKPAPDIFAAALEKAGVGAREAIALGDTLRHYVPTWSEVRDNGTVDREQFRDLLFI
jgi:FMN phosphatase YigB (HAD superfamily)